MSKVFINATKRDELGSNKTKHLRNKGFVPGTLYGGHMDSTPITMNKVEVDRFFADNNIGSKVFVNLEGKEIMAFAKSMQKDVFGKGILHVDLQALTKTDKFKMSVRLNYIGKESLPSGSVVQELVNIIEVETLPENMTETINVDVSELKFGDIIKVSDLSIMQDENFKVFTAPEITIFSLAHPSAAEPQPDSEAVAVAVTTE